MKTKQLFLSLLLCVTATVAAASPQQFNFVKGISQQIDFAEQHQTEVWPGFHPANHPTVIAFSYDEQTHVPVAYALNFKPNSLPWEKTGINNAAYFLADASALDIFSNGDDKMGFRLIDGNNSYTTIEDDSYIKNENIGNSFMRARAGHYITDESSINKEKLSYLTSPYDRFNDLNAVKLIYLEDAALTLAQSADAERAESALKDAVAIHQYRNKLYNNKADYDFENGIEITMGTPVYISLKSQNLNEHDYRKISQRTGCVPLEVMQSTDGIFQCVIAGFPAYAASVYGHALDKKVPPLAWKHEVEQQFKSASNIAIDYYHFNTMQVKMMTQAAVNNPAYNYPRINKIVNAIMQKHVNNMHATQKAYKEAPGIAFQMDAQPGLNVLYSSFFDQKFSEQFHVNINDYLFTDITSSTKEQDDQDAPEFKQLPFMALHIHVVNGTMEPEDKESYTAFKLENTAEVKLDGVNYTAIQLALDKREITFQTLEVTDTHCHIVANNGGTLDSRNGVLRLSRSLSQTRR